MFKNVFISYAKEDFTVAESLYDHLLEVNYSPWLDKRKLQVGSNWDYEIKKALKESTFVILLLSSTSVAKRGYVQKEYRLTLEYAETKLEDDIYIIPVLLDKCSIPFNLDKFQWVEYSGENAIKQIIDALNHQRAKYLLSTSKDKINIDDYVNKTFDLKIKSKTKVDFSCTIPQFINNPYFDETFVNIFIQHAALVSISNYRSFLKDYPEKNDFDLSIELACNISRLTKHSLSISMSDNNYMGGPRPNTSITTLNFLFNPERLCGLDDIIEFGLLSDFVKECLEKYGTEEQKHFLHNHLDLIDQYGIDFLINDKSLEIILLNKLPRYMMPLSFIEIPLSKLNLKVEI
jgi:TIR domain